MMRTIFVVVLMAAGASCASEPAGFHLWKSGDLASLEKHLASKLDAGKLAAQTLAGYGNHSCMLAHREGDGEAELHATQNDIFFVQSGEATLVVGGTLFKPRNTAPHEWRGTGIQGGEKRPLAVGDVVHIPFQTPHQMLVAPGHQITYFVVKINAP
jgi:mannose-6-phosphate isomerase-like protein (cupin superfamily)